MIYEFECPKGHITEAVVPMGTRTWTCGACIAEAKAQHVLRPRYDSPGYVGSPCLAFRILSPTRTTFRHADRSATKRPRE